MEFSSPLLFFSVIWSCIHVVLVVSRKRPRRGRGHLPPGPLPIPIVGCLFKLGKKPNHSLLQLAKIHGPLMTVKLGSLTAVIASSSHMAKEILQRHDQALSSRTVVDAVRVLGYAEASIAWVPPDARWRRLRLLCSTQLFTARRLDASRSLRQHKVQELIAHVRRKCAAGQAVNIGHAAFATVLNLISNTVFSVDMVDPFSDSAQEFRDLVRGITEDMGEPNVVDYFPLLRRLDPQGVRRRMEARLQKLHTIFDRMIDERLRWRSLEKNPRKNDFLDAALDCSEESASELKRPDIKGLFVDIFTAGTDTTTSTVEWAMAELLHNPKAMETVRSEITSSIGSGQPVQESDIGRLPYLQAVVKETFRLHPPAPLLPHKAESNAEICGFTIPKNTQVLVNAWAIGRDGESWVDPNSFRPERFLVSEQQRNISFEGHDFRLIPFGAGRRMCPGMPLADRMVHLMLASLLHCFAWKLPDGMSPEELDMDDKFGITLQKAVPLLAMPIIQG
ncbi:hypothetical protein ACLOJK_033539 [Asimina triloba]